MLIIRSLCYAKTKFQRDLAYSNRANIYFKLKLYKDCLKNLRKIEFHDFSKKERKQILQMKETCDNNLQDYEPDPKEDPWNFFKLSYKANDKIPFIIDRICSERDEFGQVGVFAKKKIKAGSIIAVEKSFINLISDSERYSRCCWCASSNKLNLIPCDYTGRILIN